MKHSGHAVIEQRIREGIEWARASGYVVKPGLWIDGEKKRCCALGAVGLKRYVEKVGPEHPFIGLEVRVTAADALGVAEKSIDAFVKAFDGKPNSNKKFAMAQLGEQFRQECLAFNDKK